MNRYFLRFVRTTVLGCGLVFLVGLHACHRVPGDKASSGAAEHTLMTDLFRACRAGDESAVRQVLHPTTLENLDTLFAPTEVDHSPGLEQFMGLVAELPEPTCHTVTEGKERHLECRGLLTEFTLPLHEHEGRLTLEFPLDDETRTQLIGR